MNKIHNKILNFDHTLQIIHAHHASGQRYSKVDKGADGARLTLALKAHGRQTEGYEWPKINYSLSTKLRNIVNEIRFIRTYIFTSGHLVLHFFSFQLPFITDVPPLFPLSAKISVHKHTLKGDISQILKITWDDTTRTQWTEWGDSAEVSTWKCPRVIQAVSPQWLIAPTHWWHRLPSR